MSRPELSLSLSDNIVNGTPDGLGLIVVAYSPSDFHRNACNDCSEIGERDIVI